MDEKEKQLLADCLNHKSEAQRQLYERYKVAMYRLCLRYAANKQEAEDFLQEGFIKVFSDLRQFRGDGPLGAWIRQVVLRTSLQHLRRRIHHISFVSDEHIPDTPDDTPFPLDTPDTRQLVNLIQQLPDGYRTVFNLFVVEDFSHKEIAATLGISENTSKTQLFKAKAMLRRSLEKLSVH